MKVGNVQTNYFWNMQGGNKPIAAPGFTGADVVKTTEDIFNNIIAKKKGVKWLNKFEAARGELGSILITAIGTGLVAPFSIAFNPFVKAKPDATEEEKKEVANTKAYTALRQPISAMLAVFFQVGALKPIDMFLDKISNDPALSKNFPVELDQSAIQKKKYIERITKKEMKDLINNKKSLNNILSDEILERFKNNPQELKTYLLNLRDKPENADIRKFIDKIAAKDDNEVLSAIDRIKRTAGVSSKKEFDQELKKQVKEVQSRQINKISECIEQTGQIIINGKSIKNSEVAEYINYLVNEYIKDAKNLKIDPDSGIPFYVTRATTLINNKESLNNILSDEVLKRLKDNPREFKNYLVSLRDKRENTGIQKILDEIIAAPDELRESRCFRTIDRIKKILQACGGSYDAEKYAQVLADRNDILDGKISKLKAYIIEDPSKATADSIKQTITNLIKTCQYDVSSSKERDIYENSRTFQPKLEDLGKKIRKDIAQRYKQILENRYKGYGQIIKVIIGVFITLPITCTALNWLYPRLMDIFFPSLGGAKKASDAKKNGGGE